MSQIKSGESAPPHQQPESNQQQEEQSRQAAVEPVNMPDEPTPEQLQRTIDTLLETAERCYLLARRITDRQAMESLLQLAEECEQRAEELREGPP